MKRRIAVLTSMFLLCACCIMPVSNVSAAFSPRTTAPSYDNQYYYSNLNYYYSIGYGMPNCTAYAYGRAYEILGSKPNLCSNNAGEWWFYNQTYNYYPSGLEPALGAIACWWDGGWSGTRTGHVAVVEGINGDTVVTSNSGYNSTNFWIQNRNKNSMSYDYNGKTYQFLGYIYVNGSNGSAPTTPTITSVKILNDHQVAVDWNLIDGATSYVCTIVKAQDGFPEVATAETGWYSYTFDFSEIGTYYAIVTAKTAQVQARKVIGIVLILILLRRLHRNLTRIFQTMTIIRAIQ